MNGIHNFYQLSGDYIAGAAYASKYSKLYRFVQIFEKWWVWHAGCLYL